MASQELNILNLENGEQSSYKLDAKVEALTDAQALSLSRVVNWQLSKRRSGTANIKDMSEISGTTKKPYKQKGTGNARQGSKRSVQFVGGRTCHGPKTRSFEHSLPKKIVKESVPLSVKNKMVQGKLILATNIDKAADKTAKLATIFAKNKLDSALVIYENEAKNLVKSIRNLKNNKAIAFANINSYDIINHDFLVIEQDLFDKKILKEIKNND